MQKLDGLPSMENDMSKIARIPVSPNRVGWPGFASWLRVTHPGAYKAVALRLARDGDLNGLGIVAPTTDPVSTAAATPSMWDKLSATIRDILPQAVQVYSQKKILDMQIKRAEQNLPLYDTAALADASSVKVGVDQSTRNTGLIIAAVVGAALILPKLLRR